MTVSHIVCGTLTYGGLCHAVAGHMKCCVLSGAGNILLAGVLSVKERNASVRRSAQAIKDAEEGVQVVEDAGEDVLTAKITGVDGQAIEDARDGE